MTNRALSFPPEPLDAFVPQAVISGPHAQTMVGYFWPDSPRLPLTRWHRLLPDDRDEMLLLEDRPAHGIRERGAALLIHGLGGHGESRYGTRMAARLIGAGWRTFRVSMRGAGGRKRAADRLYNAGSSDDLACAAEAAARRIPRGVPLIPIGFSLGGNILLKYLSEPGRRLPDAIAGAIAVNPPVDLEACVRRIGEPRNLIYEQNFVNLLKAEMRGRRGALARPELLRPLAYMSLREFDERITAPVGGFECAADYYARCSSAPLLGGLATDTVILASDDDPFIPADVFDRLPASDRLRVHLTHGGGHMGFISREKTPLGDRRWMDWAVMCHAERLIAKAG